MLFRLCKAALVAAAALFLLLVVFNNLTDYGSNYAFVQHVLAMDTTFEANQARWRAIEQPALYHLFYAVIIAWEAVAGVLCAVGAWHLVRARAASAASFHRAKRVAFLGLTVSLLQWLVAFLTVGGEWFLMWQSRVWNGQDAAFRMFACFGIILILLALDDKELSDS